MVSAKQVSRWRPTCRPHTCWCRGKLFLRMGEYLLDYRQLLDAGDDPHRPAAGPAGFDVDAEYAFQALS